MYHCPNPVVADIVHCPAMVLLDGRVRHRRRLLCLSVLCCAGCCAVRVAAAAMANELALFAGAAGVLFRVIYVHYNAYALRS